MSGKNASPVQRRVKNPIEEHACLNEAIKKEKLSSTIYETFTLNPRSCNHHTVVLLTDKPNRTGLLDVNTAETEMQISEDMRERLSRANAVPKAKAAFPQTSNQEFGWDADLVIFIQPVYKSTWNHTKPACAETKYASSYYTMTGRSPYSNKLGSPESEARSTKK